MRILGRKFYAYKSKNRRKNTPDSAFPRTLHAQCEGLTEEELGSFSGTTAKYTCENCFQCLTL